MHPHKALREYWPNLILPVDFPAPSLSLLFFTAAAHLHQHGTRGTICEHVWGHTVNVLRSCVVGCDCTAAKLHSIL